MSVRRCQKRDRNAENDDQQPETVRRARGGAPPEMRASPTHSIVIPVGPGRGTVLLLAVASGTAVANLYYVQPLLATLGPAFHLTGNSTGFFVTLTQIGYACGLFFLVPLGDLFDRRSLILGFFGVGSAVLFLAALSPNAVMFAVCSIAVGLLSVSAQIIVPYAAHAAPEDQRGRTVGTVMSGLLLGVLFARTFSGLLSHLGGWRMVYCAGAALMLVLMAVLWRRLPSQPAEGSVESYRRLLGSIYELFRTQPVLRRRSLYGSCVFAAFSVFWTGATFLLSRQPYSYNDAVIGLFGLCGAAGAFSASLARPCLRQGSYPDRHRFISPFGHGVVCLQRVGIVASRRGHRRRAPAGFWRARHTDSQPESDLQAGSNGAQPAHGSLHDALFPRRCRGLRCLSHHVQSRRMDGGVHGRRRLCRGGVHLVAG